MFEEVFEHEKRLTEISCHSLFVYKEWFRQRLHGYNHKTDEHFSLLVHLIIWCCQANH
jgi:hypothetical protein